MHSLIAVLTEALTKHEAAASAFAYADQLVEEGEFDYYNRRSELYNLSGRTYRLTSKAGGLLVAEALRANRTEFDQALKAARHMLSHCTDEQLYQDDIPPDPTRDYWASRYQFAILGGMTHDCYLYGEPQVWGGKIQNDREYAAATNGHEADNLWVTAIDFHH